MVSTSIDQLACVLREHRSPDSLVILPLLLAAAAAFGPGTFTELGAFDGESGSQTVHLERCFGWRGLLLEANPTNYAQIASKQRDHATVVHSAVCSQRVAACELATPAAQSRELKAACHRPTRQNGDLSKARV